MRPTKIRLGEILVEQGLLSPAVLTESLAKAKLTGKKLGRVLIDAKHVNEEALVKALATQLGIPFIDLAKTTLSAEAAQALPETVARKCACLVVDKTIRPAPHHPLYTVAMSDPADVFIYDEIQKILFPGDVEIVAATEEAIFTAIDRVYRKKDEIEELSVALTKEFTSDESALDLAQIGIGAGIDAPVVKLLQSIFEDAIARRASDIHIEPMDSKLLVRIRVDGTMHVLIESDPKTAAPLAQRLKLVSGLNISERRLPQDGRFNIKVHRYVIDVRIATSPTAYGESVVMRLLNQNNAHLDVSQLNMPPETYDAFLKALSYPQGMILVTGPTGSGKTTTLYSAMSKLNSTENKLITVEDPIEYKIQGINQIQTHEKIGLTFNAALRSILRQDPDVILVGEMRDRETVDAALRASMTGHLVLSTLHTNDAKSAASRLIDMGAEPFLVGQSLQLILAQRLVRLNCTHCSQSISLNPSDQVWTDAHVLQGTQAPPIFKAGSGCEQCSHTGHLGRAAVYEHISVDKQLALALSQGGQAFAALAGQIMATRTLAHHANQLARQGLISVREARRVSYENQ